MDYSKFFSTDVPSFLRSPVREIFKKVDLNAIYSFAGGYPNAATFPLEDIKRLSTEVIEKYGANAFQYGATQGLTLLRETLSKRYGVPVENIQITTSSQQGIDVCSRILLDPGDVVFAQAPVYLGALQSFRAYRAVVKEIPEQVGDDGCLVGDDGCLVGDDGCLVGDDGCLVGDDGVIADKGTAGPTPVIADSVRQSRPKALYVIPDFNNPSGKTKTLEERQALVDFARRNDLIIIEDSPYKELRYEGEDVPSIYSLAPERTLHLGSFSKIFAPGFRLGWIFGPTELLEQIYVCKQALDLCPPIFDQYLAAEFMGSGALDANLAKSKELYRSKRDYLLELLQKYMPEGVSWTHPEGGLFLWLTLPEEVDTVAMYDSALKAGVAYVAGSFFYPDGSHRNTMRLNFSFLDTDRMEAGIKILAEQVRKNLVQRWSGAGNLFVVADGRGKDLSALRSEPTIQNICAKYGTDGLMILDDSAEHDFKMEFYNPDGSGGMMCGNGGRCIAAFADSLGVKPAHEGHYCFDAPDGLHSADLLQTPKNGDGKWVIRLKMRDVSEVKPVLDGYFLNTGTRHFVKFVPDVDDVDVENEGKGIRWMSEFAPEGTNVNFVSAHEDGLHVRTFEKGVERETLACGTGITASAIAAFAVKFTPPAKNDDGRISYSLKARQDWLKVDFLPDLTDVYLTGPAEILV